MAAETILIVDDSPTVVRGASTPLINHGYRVLTAGDGEEAILTATREHPHLIILDIILPKRNGFEVCRILKTNPQTKGIKIMLLSSKSNDSDRFWGLRQGADSYMTKPFEDEDLIANVEQLLGRSTPLPK